MVVMRMCEQDGVDGRSSGIKHLLSKIRTCIDKDVQSVDLNESRSAKPAVTLVS